MAVRPNKVSTRDFAHPPAGDHSLRAFLDALPDVLVARDFRAVVAAVADAAQRERGVVIMLGGHIVKTGLAPVLVELMRRRVVTHVAMNGSAAIHDFEIARFGATSEDVAAGLVDGTFGMAEETGREMNEAFVRGMREQRGMGEVLGVVLDEAPALAHPELSLLLSARRLGVPLTVHAALGAEIIHQHPSASGAAIGDTSHRDFRRLAHSLIRIDGGGVVLNLGSAVIMPEVFLKALSIAQNMGFHVDGFTTANFDMTQHYRPLQNVVKRPTAGDSRGLTVTGHHEIMIPLLAAGILDRIGQLHG